MPPSQKCLCLEDSSVLAGTTAHRGPWRVTWAGVIEARPIWRLLPHPGGQAAPERKRQQKLYSTHRGYERSFSQWLRAGVSLAEIPEQYKTPEADRSLLTHGLLCLSYVVYCLSLSIRVLREPRFLFALFTAVSSGPRRVLTYQVAQGVICWMNKMRNSQFAASMSSKLKTC